MSDATADTQEVPAKPSKLPLLIGIVLALAGAGGGYYAVSSGMLSLGTPQAHSTAEIARPEALPDIAFIEIEPIMISLNGGGDVEHLRFRAHLEVNAAHQSEVETLQPRIIDVLNGYLRALEVDDLRDPLALTRLRAQMLRRIQIVTGKGRVRDLLITDFVLN